MKNGRMLIPTILGNIIVRVSTGLHDEGVSGTFPAGEIDAVREAWLGVTEDYGEVDMSPQDVAKDVVRAVLEGMPDPEIRPLISAAALWLATEGKDGSAMLERARRGDCLIHVIVSEDAIDGRCQTNANWSAKLLHL